jgi:hypothetical protein
VIVATREPHRQAEGLRAALGLTLRGADVLAVTAPPTSPLAQRAIATLEPFGHRVTTAIDLDADAVEVWTGDAPVTFPVVRRGPRRILHIIRGTAPPDGAVANGDSVVYLSEVDHDELVALAFAHDLVITW